MTIRPNEFADLGHVWEIFEPPSVRDQMELSMATEGVLDEPTRTVVISYSHEGEDEQWMREVRTFARWLHEQEGIVVACDQFGAHLNQAWSSWGAKAIASADIALCLASPTYAAEWLSDRGSGAAVEARAIRNSYEHHNKGFVFVILPSQSSAGIPIEAIDHHRVEVRSIDAAGVEELVRLIRNRPRFLLGPLGAPRDLPSED